MVEASKKVVVADVDRGDTSHFFVYRYFVPWVHPGPRKHCRSYVIYRLKNMTCTLLNYG
jgi:hypothetical protein